ncbi:iron(III) ABC transporter iron (III)-binding protein [Celeribacter indicus]|uniref:Iron(III) ABC transporter iron (III)-binding protein n=2 Tax=Celeribacter indicus TaxID=1208324 RepID=A0A0B5E2R9_9RHOB|nr:iron(III) ABC transporter iron (III)-binding protein [Celeribacter indicus]
MGAIPRVSSRLALVVAAAAGSLLTGATEASAQAAEQNPHIEELIEQARQEGSLYLNWSDYGDIIGDWVDGYLETYGLKGEIEVVHTPNPNGTAAFLQLEEEFSAGRPAHTDIMEGAELRTALGISGFRRSGGFLADIDYASLPNVAPAMVKGDGKTVVYAHIMPGISYNTNTVAPEDLPKNIEDYTDPTFLNEYNVASTGQASGFDFLFTEQTWGFERACEFTTRLGAGIAGLIEPHEATRIASGEFDMLIFDQGLRPLQLAASGAPVAITYPEGYTFRRAQHFSIPENAEHKAAAQLFINYMLSPEAQQILYDKYRIDSHDRDGSLSAGTLAQVSEQTGTPTDIDIAFIEQSYMDEIRPAIPLMRGMLTGEYGPDDCAGLAEQVKDGN